jgi:hypothetical protein
MRYPALICLAALLSIACAKPDGDAPKAERADSSGIALITNRGPDRLLSATFTPRLTLGGKDDGPESFFRVVRGSVAVDGAGNIHVLDFEAKTIAIFDSTGKYIRTLGRPGDGPGELRFPNTVRTTADGRVSVFDFSKEGIVRWNADGTLLPSMRVKATSPIQDLAFTDEGVVYSYTDFAEEGKDERSVLQVERADTVEELVVQARPQPKMLSFKNCGIMLRLPPLFTPELSWSTNEHRIAWTSKVAYEIDIRDPGGKRSVVRRDLAPREATLDLAQREVGDSMRVRASTIQCAVGPSEVAEARGFAAVMPSIRTVVIAPDGSLWVQRMTPRTDPAVIDLFTASGEYRGTLPADSPMPLAFFPNGDIAATQKDKENDVERLVVYRVTVP